MVLGLKRGAAHQVVDDDDLRDRVGQELFDDVGADEPGSTEDDDALV
jgi:hypothetical protein